ncbi:hypothetical protein QEJ31_01275 [Pigmentibacter sp. JX0631]|uniref:hypothetical protein n=1 Tax=Pigmentibacter sp. JX0631 TaxID=2976982 RepID=UPI0024693C0C|nr:hypothetical protein [Pigmentibacter sp. JX0631]WGL60235.1 hypothetical protein QEJ31_01275 [Pigmentibacter sp. JX0631]
MKCLFKLMILFYGMIQSQFAFSQAFNACDTSVVSSANCTSTNILIYEPNQSTGTFAPPTKYISNGNPVPGKIGKLQFTYSVILDARNVDNFNYDANKWGIRFGLSSASPVDYYPGAGNLGSVTVSSKLNLSASGKNYFAGTVAVTLDFTNASNQLPTDIVGKMSNSSITLQPLYYNGSSPVARDSLAFQWQADQGAMINPPTISVTAQDQAFVVTLKGPSDTSAVLADSASSTLKATANNSISGYIIVYWLDSDAKGNATGCRASPGNWSFQINPAALSAASTKSYLCSYQQYQSSFKAGGTSSVIGCASAGMTGFLPLASGPAPLTADNVAIPYTPSYSNPNTIPSDSNGTPSGCYNVVYVPGSQTTWSKGNLKNGDIYGIMAWALNSVYDTTTNTVKPNYSLAHSNISYVTGVYIPLASTDKTPDLAKTKDCFVVTAASGDPNSSSVFYWRLLRDEYLTPIGFTKFYYQHAQSWAQWLDEHPRLKPALNFIFETSGKYFYKLSGLVKSFNEYISEKAKSLKNIFVQEASAQELPAQIIDEKSISVENHNTDKVSQTSSSSDNANKTAETPKEDKVPQTSSSSDNANNTAESPKDDKVPQTSSSSDNANNTAESPKDDKVPQTSSTSENTDKTKDLSPKEKPEDIQPKEENNPSVVEPIKEDLNSSPKKINKNIIPPTAQTPQKKEMRDKSSSYYYAKDEQPNYDLFITGGILMPTDDQKYYDKYYSSQQTAHFELGANYIWWFFDYLGLSLGLQGKYVFNKGSDNVTMLGTQQPINRQIYALIAEGIVGARFRNPRWAYIQPGVYLGVGAVRMREDSDSASSNSNTDKPLGVTKYSPIFEFGGNLDISLVPIFSITPGELGIFLSDVLLRLSIAYNNNPSPALSTSGIFLQGGFVFLFE